ncbi:MAG TPA: MarR family transcriptional regulator [Kineosporiaceae bacterium]|nr:MarR family transcriptional regulator [Kineosporiaceae bacterium]
MDADDGLRDDILRAIEHFALLLTDSGVPRMPARVFAYMLADDATAHTAPELAAGLQVSPAAVSGAVRYLQQVGFVIRGREPGARLDHYRLRGDLWYEMYATRMALLDKWDAALGEAADLLGPGRPGTARLRESQEFFAFLRADMPVFMERWHQHRDRLRADGG